MSISSPQSRAGRWDRRCGTRLAQGCAASAENRRAQPRSSRSAAMRQREDGFFRPKSPLQSSERWRLVRASSWTPPTAGPLQRAKHPPGRCQSSATATRTGPEHPSIVRMPPPTNPTSQCPAGNPADSGCRARAESRVKISFQEPRRVSHGIALPEKIGTAGRQIRCYAHPVKPRHSSVNYGGGCLRPRPATSNLPLTWPRIQPLGTPGSATGRAIRPDTPTRRT